MLGLREPSLDKPNPWPVATVPPRRKPGEVDMALPNALGLPSGFGDHLPSCELGRGTSAAWAVSSREPKPPRMRTGCFRSRGERSEPEVEEGKLIVCGKGDVTVDEVVVVLVEGPASGEDLVNEGVLKLDGGGGGGSVDARSGEGAIGEVPPSRGRLCDGGEI